MIELYKASAGSGKTYNLAKRYIEYLISERDEGSGKRKLRTVASVRDSVSHILAITFTNKATNEMKERIVEKLADLAGRKNDVNDTDYLKDFMKDFGASERDVRKICRLALAELLINYSDFHVSTIDSFFQSVLRTFAYESDLSDTYQVEIDSDWSARVGVDATLSSVNGPDPDPEVKYWLNLLMEKKREGKWDLFQKSESSHSEYTSMFSKAKSLESERFKEVRSSLDDYCREDATRLRRTYEVYESYFNDKERVLMAKGIEEGDRLEKELEKYPSLDTRIANYGYISDHIAKLRRGDISFMSNKYPYKENFFKSKVTPIDEVNESLRRFYDTVDEVKMFRSSPPVVVWNLYKAQLPYIGLLLAVRRNAAQFFENNNVVQLSETNSLLERVIGDDDAPFIYERIGAHLNHYLIDEFQDTSRMQWKNLRPLLNESEGRGEENLIIGDAKQSIYRFRNADPSIIRHTVPEEFPDTVMRGHLPADNTNYRSWSNIVRFNNSFFRQLAGMVDVTGALSSPLTPLYSNVEQVVHHKDKEGYVSIRLLTAEESKTDNFGSDNTEAYPPFLTEVIGVIDDIRARGYNLRDIGILVSKNFQASQIVNAFLDYNRGLGPEEDGKRIRFISDMSLAISSSEAVKIIVSTLEMIEKFGPDEELGVRIEESGEEGKSGEKGAEEEDIFQTAERINEELRIRDNVYTIASSFNFYSVSHPELRGAELVRGFFLERDTRNMLLRLRPWVQANALPSIVEAVIGVFVPEYLKAQDAPYIAAFQDLVAEQCERYAMDAASFMLWWRRFGVRKSLSSPAGQDAISIMTIHKAKGLAFDFVIVPYLEQVVNVSKADIRHPEWRWVKPTLCELTAEGEKYRLPDAVAIELDNEMKKLYYSPQVPYTEEEETQMHLDSFREYVDSSTMDNVNNIYVAMTRPVKELYIYSPVERDKKSGEPKDNGKIGYMLATLMDSFPSEELEYGLRGGEVAKCDECEGYIIGVKAPGAEVEKTLRMEKEEKKRKEKEERILRGEIKADREELPEEERVVEKYVVYRRSESFQYREDPCPPYDAEDPDPRSEGNRMHTLLQWVKEPSDLERAIARMQVSGETTEEELCRCRELLTERINNAPEGWFDPSSDVYTERDILQSGRGLKRPDRIVVKDHSAIVIDYKFGRQESGHRKQVSEYAGMLSRTGMYRSVKAYLWYVIDNVIVEVK